MVFVFKSSFMFAAFYTELFLYLDINMALYIIIACAFTYHQGSIINFLKLYIFSFII